MDPRGTQAGPYAEEGYWGLTSLPEKCPYFYAADSVQLKLFKPACSTVGAFTRLHPLIYFSPRLDDQVNCLKLIISLCRPSYWVNEKKLTWEYSILLRLQQISNRPQNPSCRLYIIYPKSWKVKITRASWQGRKSCIVSGRNTLRSGVVRAGKNLIANALKSLLSFSQ